MGCRLAHLAAQSHHRHRTACAFSWQTSAHATSEITKSQMLIVVQNQQRGQLRISASWHILWLMNGKRNKKEQKIALSVAKIKKYQQTSTWTIEILKITLKHRSDKLKFYEIVSL